MKFVKNSILGAAMGAAMLSGCGQTPSVSGKTVNVSPATSPLKLNSDDMVNTTTDQAIWYVKSASLFGYYRGCLGHVSGTGWTMAIGQGNALVKVAQSDSSCGLYVVGINRILTDKISGHADKPEKYYFHTITTQPSGGQSVDGRDLTALMSTTDSTLYQNNASDVLIRDGYNTLNVRMAVRDDNLAIGLINIAGINTGAGAAGTGGFFDDFQVNVLTGATATDLFNTNANSQINYSVNLQASAKELPAPTYNIDPNTVRIAVDPNGIITPASSGAFKFIVTSKNYVTQPGTEYIFPRPTDGDTCSDSLAQLVGCDPTKALSATVDPTVLPSDTTYSRLNESQQYMTLWSRWQLLKALGRTVNTITTSDKSISIGTLSFFPPGTPLFSPRKDTNNNIVGYDNVHNTQVVVIRNRATGTAGSDFDVNSNVISYQAFQVTVQKPSF